MRRRTRLATAVAAATLVGFLWAGLGPSMTRNTSATAVASASAFASLPASPSPALKIGRPDQLSSSHYLSRWSVIRVPAVAHAAPSARSAVVARLATRTPEDTADVVTVLSARTGTDGRVWVEVRLPVLPNGSVGWVNRRSLGGYQTVRHAPDHRPRTAARDALPGRRTHLQRSGGNRRGSIADPPRRVHRPQPTNPLREPVLRPSRVRNDRSLGGADRLARRWLHRDPRDERTRRCSRSYLARLHPSSQRRHPAAGSADAGRNAGDDQMSRTGSLSGYCLAPWSSPRDVTLAVSTAGLGAPAARTPRTLNPPTALWKAYPLRQAHSGQQARRQQAGHHRDKLRQSNLPDSRRNE